MNRKPVDMAAPLIPPPEDGAHTLTCRLSDEKEATRLLDEQPQPLGRVRDRWSNTCEPPQREYRVTVLVLALTDAEVVHSGGVIRSAIGEYQPEVYEANSPAGETEGRVLSPRGSCAPWMRTAGILVGVRGECATAVRREFVKIQSANGMLTSLAPP